MNNCLLQFQADLLQTNVARPKITETTALGAAYLAGLAVKYWDDLQEMRQQWKIDRVFKPEVPADETIALIKGWNKAVRVAIAWTEDI